MSKKHIITLGGLPGSGKSTVKRLLVETLNYQSFSTGDFARSLAVGRGLSLEEFNELVTKDKSLDLHIDEEQTRIGLEEDEYIIDSILGFHFIPNSFKIHLSVPLEVSAKRIFGDKNSTLRVASHDSPDTYEETLEKTRRRIENHKGRYFNHYGVHIYDEKNFDLVIDTTSKTPQEVAETILSGYKTWLLD
jgi:CMP/dCMP kinase